MSDNTLAVHPTTTPLAALTGSATPGHFRSWHWPAALRYASEMTRWNPRRRYRVARSGDSWIALPASDLDWTRFEGVHPPGVCAGRACVVHGPSEHHMRDWPMVWRPFRGQVERTCPHGIGHPDPDQAGDTTHGCDGCCGVPR